MAVTVKMPAVMVNRRIFVIRRRIRPIFPSFRIIQGDIRRKADIYRRIVFSGRPDKPAEILFCFQQIIAVRILMGPAVFRPPKTDIRRRLPNRFGKSRAFLPRLIPAAKQKQRTKTAKNKNGLRQSFPEIYHVTFIPLFWNKTCKCFTLLRRQVSFLRTESQSRNAGTPDLSPFCPLACGSGIRSGSDRVRTHPRLSPRLPRWRRPACQVPPGRP